MLGGWGLKPRNHGWRMVDVYKMVDFCR
jgi:hypothetical protein